MKSQIKLHSEREVSAIKRQYRQRTPTQIAVFYTSKRTNPQEGKALTFRTYQNRYTTNEQEKKKYGERLEQRREGPSTKELCV
jgi:hypothetical protein